MDRDQWLASAPDVIASLDEGALLGIQQRVTQRLDAMAQDGLAESLAEALAEAGVTNAVTAEFGTTEWENGYFYDEHALTVYDAHHVQIQLADDAWEAVAAAVADALTEMSSANGPLGQRSILTIDLTTRTVTD